MQFEISEVYHVFNRGNNKQQIFFSDRNYLFFLRKLQTYIKPYCDVMAYCLMPNHFHLLLHANEESVRGTGSVNPILESQLSERFRVLLSSYALAINAQEGRTGSLFQQNTKAKKVSKQSELVSISGCDLALSYAEACFHYIHQNPVKAGLVQAMEDWPFSSFRDYAGLRNGSLPSIDFTLDYFSLKKETFYREITGLPLIDL